jgi:tRNA nucleotidyltransferase (CCA-adding enzyme)
METANILKQLEAQDERLLRAVKKLAKNIGVLKADPKYPASKPRALLVGGFVRDAILGLKPKDADMEVYGVNSKRLEETLTKLFPKCVNAVGRAFGVFKISVGEGLDFDIAIPRRESKTGKGHKGFAIEGDPSMSLKEAARRRDFTINALAADPLTGEVFDEFGGIKDLKDGVLRVTDTERFQDDPLRVYRGIQFAARLNLEVEPKTLKLMRDMVARGDMDELASERVTEELKKLLLKAEKPSKGFELARELGLIKRDYPELDALIDLPQEAEWHPEGDAWTHTMMTVDAAAKIIREKKRGFTEEEQLEVMLGALCHDLGKATTTEFIEGRTRSRGHEEAGEAPARTLCGRLSFSNDVVEAAAVVAKDHLKPGAAFRAHAKVRAVATAVPKGELNEDQYANAIRKLLKRIAPVSWRILIAASEADFRGRKIPGVDKDVYDTGKLFESVIKARGLDAEPAKPLVQGRDLLELGVKPGKQMGEIIKRIEEARDEGKIKTHEEAMKLVKRRLKTSRT